MSEIAAYEPEQSICLRPEEFVDDAESRLGRANGNTYQRKPGVDNAHDGQIMIRLKKKRYIIIDYGYTPTAHDYEIAKTVPHIKIPNGAGQLVCSTKDCQRIGVPVLLYDSEPNEPMSLYLRGGLCFSCQRSLNEKRRTQRKRKSDVPPAGEVRIGGDMPSIGSGSGNSSRFKYNDQIVELNPEAVVINGPVDGTRTRGPDYRCPEIGSDLLTIVSELSQETLSLLQHSSGAGAGMAPTADSVNRSYQKAFLSASRATFLLTQWKASWDSQQHATEAAVASENFDSRVLDEAVLSTETALTQGFSTYQPGLSQAAAIDGESMQSLMMPGDTMSNNEHEDAASSIEV
mmetsp:Transcript_6427/g.14499  ORF Transcript_6427/g.14499 Transcript_6427/m.14499 type:complete len:346 (-) Transcript_6427:133-1170(-)|eukprot:CAMPEP_0172314280 /NCGR_PEP_ID=MMETSP1058-20130122/22141_1 /TAXON_ID=83371 /ORGANISM="Detonula confervacea, Strain CCMP 353" /LENGTH=345 /DNA_ID=CAMNT_0013028105 /DNA_START=419 /DNA_END=1456 /DNA_ORIENTATION=+